MNIPSLIEIILSISHQQDSLTKYVHSKTAQTPQGVIKFHLAGFRGAFKAFFVFDFFPNDSSDNGDNVMVTCGGMVAPVLYIQSTRKS